MVHGNWKELVLASGRGNLTTMQYHLDQDVDPTFQHPEFFTAPIFEAIRKNQESAARLLIEHDRSQLSLVEEMNGYTPLQCALQERKHDMADVLLSFPDLPQTDRQMIQNIFVLGDPTNALESNVIERLLENGQRLFVCPPSSANNDYLKAFVQDMVETTGNRKLTVLSRQSNAEEWESMDFILAFHDLSCSKSMIQTLSRKSKPHLVWVTLPVLQRDAPSTLEELGLNSGDCTLVETTSYGRELGLLDPILRFLGMETRMETLVKHILKLFGYDALENSNWF